MPLTAQKSLILEKDFKKSFEQMMFKGESTNHFRREHRDLSKKLEAHIAVR